MSEITAQEAAKRCSEIVSLHLLADRERAINSWIAIRLSDGGSDNILYDSKKDAIRHQLHETQCAYLKITPDGCPPRQAEIFLRANRQAYDAGLRFGDPDQPNRELIIPMRREFLL
jgi:hypothetical protein